MFTLMGRPKCRNPNHFFFLINDKNEHLCFSQDSVEMHI